MKLLRIRRGHSPNCSATGSVVGLALASAVGCAAIVNAFADRFTAWVHPPRQPEDPDPSTNPDGEPEPLSPQDPAPRIRLEAFGGILAWPNPPALLYVDEQATTEALRAGAKEVGQRQAAPNGALSAPTEAHISVTERCPVKCTGCYLNAGPDREHPEHLQDLERDLDALADMGVFEIALGGGEVAMHEDIVGICERIQNRGMTPNLTTSGFGLTRAMVKRLAPLVGQINVSYDGVGEAYVASRGWKGEPLAKQAITRLKDAGIRVGVNTVLTKPNLPSLEPLAQQLAQLHVDEWQWLRFKPAGRGRETWSTLAPSTQALLTVWPTALALEEAYGLTIRFDCALVPFLAAHGLPVKHLEALGVSGCPAGESLWARTANGQWNPCSFAHDLTPEFTPPSTAQAWHTEPTLNDWRSRAAQPDGACATCEYRTICRGGCRVVAHHLTGDALAPDPQCPRVQRAQTA